MIDDLLVQVQVTPEITVVVADTLEPPVIAAGNIGPTGERGSLWFNGHGPPDVPDAQPGDYYLDLDTGNVYCLGTPTVLFGPYGTGPYGAGPYGGAS